METVSSLAAPPWAARASASLTSRPKTRVGAFCRRPLGRTRNAQRLRRGTTPSYTRLSYETASGRPQWLSRDPIAEAGGLNLYAYVGNNPINAIDPLGLIQVPHNPNGHDNGEAAVVFKVEAAAIFLPEFGIEGAFYALFTLFHGHGPALGTVKTYQTYTKTNPDTGQVYSGRTSGTGTPLQNIANRDSGHCSLNDQGFGPAQLDASSASQSAIRGREQQLIRANGGAQSMNGTSANKINGVSPNNPKLPQYLEDAIDEFGPME
jgi:RHS repeat-associated protein